MTVEVKKTWLESQSRSITISKFTEEDGYDGSDPCFLIESPGLVAVEIDLTELLALQEALNEFVSVNKLVNP